MYLTSKMHEKQLLVQDLPFTDCIGWWRGSGFALKLPDVILESSVHRKNWARSAGRRDT